MADDLLSGQDSGDYDAASIEVLEGLEPVRKRPGMYIGGTDERALHHLVAEVLDNAMDEAVAGHATRIEVELSRRFDSVTIRDNGRGIPVDPHPKFPGKSALEVILCTLHSGGKFSGKAYQTSGGLHGVGVSVVNALSDRLASRWRATASSGRRTSPAACRRAQAREGRRRPQPARHHDHLPPRSGDLRHSTSFKPARLLPHGALQGLPVLGRRDPLEIGGGRRRHAAGGDVPLPRRAGGLPGRDLGARHLCRAALRRQGRFQDKFGQPGSVEWAINWTPARDGFMQSYCNTVPTPEGGTHEQGFWAAILKGIRAYGELRGREEGGADHPRGPGDGRLRAGVVLHPRARVRRPDQGPAGHRRGARMVEGAVRDRFDNWLAARTRRRPAPSSISWCCAPRNGCAAAAEKETSAQVGHQEAAPAGQAGRLHGHEPRGHRAVHRRGRFGRRLGQDGARRKTQALLPLRGKILNVLGAASSKLGSNAEINDLTQALGVGLGTKFRLDDLRYDKIIIMTDADVDGAHIASLLMTFFFSQMRPLIDAGHLYLACPPLYRLTQGAQAGLLPRRGRARGVLVKKSVWKDVFPCAVA